MEKLLQLDTELLLAINSHHTPFWDQVMWYSSQSWLWIPLYILFVWVIYLLSRAYLKYSSWYIVALLVFLSVAFIAMAAGLSDFITSGLLKKSICRPRPTHSEIADLLHLVRGYTGGQYGFPSSHAANTCAVATSFLMIMDYLKRLPHQFIVPDIKNVATVLTANTLLKVLVILYVVLNCYSRMYLGVHYPLDILCGGLIGILLGYLSARLFSRLMSQQKNSGRHINPPEI